MARMSTDDSLSRDPRLDHLAELVGWTRRETAGCLQLDVWPLCYDRVTPNIPSGDIDRVASRFAVSPVKHPGGFSGALVECGLARKSTREDIRFRWEKGDGNVVMIEWRDPEWRNRIYVRGAADRIAYLIKRRVSGANGGRKSAKSRGSEQAPLEAVLTESLKHSATAANPTLTVTVTDHMGPATADAAPGGLGEVRRKTDRAAGDRAARIPDRAWKAADYLRQAVLEADPQALVHREPWGDEVRSGWRLKWADEIRLMVERDARTYEQIAEVLKFVFHEQTGDKRFVVQSADALREKFDRIQAVRRNKAEAPSKPQQKFAAIPLAPSSQRGQS